MTAGAAVIVWMTVVGVLVLFILQAKSKPKIWHYLVMVVAQFCVLVVASPWLASNAY